MALDRETLLEAAAFVRSHDSVEASIQRVGLNNTQVILIAEDGEWLRFVVPSPDDAQKFCQKLRIEGHDGYPDHLRQRMSGYRRSPEDWREAPYPEQNRRAST